MRRTTIAKRSLPAREVVRAAALKMSLTLSGPRAIGWPPVGWPQVDRREFLRLSGRVGLGSLGVGLGVGALATACTATAPDVPTPTPRTTPVPPVSTPTGPQPATDADWADFGGSLDGALLRPGQSGYEAATHLFNPRFDGSRPAGIASCASDADVQRALAFVRVHGLPVALRSGGHSYGGYSTGSGLVCDVTPLSKVEVDTGSRTVVVGAGARLIDVYSALAPHGLALPGGSCPTVGIAGLTLGGGQGVIGRKFGLTSDNVTQLRIVTAAGDLLTCTDTDHQDLLWACRGGGGGNFGAVTSFTFDVHPLTQLARFFYEWPWPATGDALAAWQAWGPHAPDELWSNCHLHTGSGSPVVSVAGTYVGSESALRSELQALTAAIPSQPTTAYVTTDGYLQTMLVEAGCSDRTVAQCHLPTQDPAGTLEREASLAKSDYFDGPLSNDAIQEIVNQIDQRQGSSASSAGGGVAFDAWGGALNRVAADATAFVHRGSLFLAQYFVIQQPGESVAQQRADAAWLNGFYTDVHPFAGGGAYQNYIDPDLADWQTAYYGSNLPRLAEIKGAYDPDGLFRFAQSIPEG
jgi:FAD/FMN-containing dehydrogenase